MLPTVRASVLTLKFHIAQVKDGGEQFGDFPGVILCEHEDLQSWTEVSVFLHIVTSFTAGAVTLMMWHLKLNVNSYLPPIKTEFYFQMLQLFQYHGQVVVLCSASKRQNLFLLSWHAHQHVVKDVVVSLLRRLHMKAHFHHNKNICTALLLLHIFRQPVFSPDDRLWTSPAGIAQRGPLRWPHPWWSWCQCTSRNDWSCHFGLFWHFQRLGRKQTRLKGDSTDYEDRLQFYLLAFSSYPPGSGSLQESAARSRSAGRSLQPGTAAWAWCSQFSLLLTPHWWGKQRTEHLKRKLIK